MLMDSLDGATQTKAATPTSQATAIITTIVVAIITRIHQAIGMDITNQAAKESTITSLKVNTIMKVIRAGIVNIRELTALAYRLALTTAPLMPAMATTASISSQSVESLRLH